MNNIDKLNTLIEYIEQNLTEDLEYKKLAQMLCVDEYTLFRVFNFVTGVSIADYIRKRRLTKAGIELRETDIKVIDLAVKYGYDSSIAFARAFKKMCGFNPSLIKNQDVELKSFPRLNISSSYNENESFNYKVIEKEETCLYGIYRDCKLESVKETADRFWKDIRKNNTEEEKYYSDIFNEKCYGILEFTNIISKIGHEGRARYYIGKEKEFKNSQKIIIPKSNWAVFKLNSKEAEDVSAFILNIYENWIPYSGYSIQEYPEIEVYSDEGVEWWLPVKYINR